MNIAFAGLRHGHIFGLYKKAKEMDGVTVIGAWEADDAARTAAQNIITEPFYNTYEALLADPAVDAVAVGDYYGIRGQLILSALKAGKHVIADKPICTSSMELTLIGLTSALNDLKVGCMLDLRYDGAVRMAKKLVEEGKLGNIHTMSFTGQHPLSYGTRPMWYFEEGKHGGTINDIAIHGVDALRYITSLEYVRTTCARTWNAFAKEAPHFDDCAQFMAEFEGGAGLIADVSYAAQTKTSFTMPSYWRFNIWGEKGCIEFRFGDNKVFFAGQDSETVEEIDCPPVTECWLDDFIKPYDADSVNDVLTSSLAVLDIQRAADDAKEGK